MFRLLQDCVWRTMRSQVVNELALPPQSSETIRVGMTPIEHYNYTRSVGSALPRPLNGRRLTFGIVSFLPAASTKSALPFSQQRSIRTTIRLRRATRWRGSKAMSAASVRHGPSVVPASIAAPCVGTSPDIVIATARDAAAIRRWARKTNASLAARHARWSWSCLSCVAKPSLSWTTAAVCTCRTGTYKRPSPLSR